MRPLHSQSNFMVKFGAISGQIWAGVSTYLYFFINIDFIIFYFIFCVEDVRDRYLPLDQKWRCVWQERLRELFTMRITNQYKCPSATRAIHEEDKASIPFFTTLNATAGGWTGTREPEEAMALGPQTPGPANPSVTRWPIKITTDITPPTKLNLLMRVTLCCQLAT